MDGLALARVLHVLGIVVWIGGVAIITAIVLPLARAQADPQAGVKLFESVERRFAWIARAMVLIVGGSGLYMIWAYDLWQRFADARFWWMHAMVAVWAIFAAMLFVAEPLAHRRMAEKLARAPGPVLRRMMIVHWLLLIASAVTIAGAVAGAHGYRLFP